MRKLRGPGVAVAPCHRLSYDAKGMTAPSSLRQPKLREKAQILSASEIERTLVRLAHEIVEKNDGVRNLGLVGIKRRGIPLAQRLARILGRIEKTTVPVGTLDIAFYRDDLSTVGHRPQVNPGPMEFDIQDKDIILVDDVLYTGRTARAALDALFDQDVRAAFSFSCSSIAAIASCRSRPPSSAGESLLRTTRSSK